MAARVGVGAEGVAVESGEGAAAALRRFARNVL